MKQREIAAKERDAGREQQVKAIVTACEKVCDLCLVGFGLVGFFLTLDPLWLKLWSIDRQLMFARKYCQAS
jgi:hypothetical protein